MDSEGRRPNPHKPMIDCLYLCTTVVVQYVCVEAPPKPADEMKGGRFSRKHLPQRTLYHVLSEPWHLLIVMVVDLTTLVDRGTLFHMDVLVASVACVWE